MLYEYSFIDSFVRQLWRSNNKPGRAFGKGHSDKYNGFYPLETENLSNVYTDLSGYYVSGTRHGHVHSLQEGNSGERCLILPTGEIVENTKYQRSRRWSLRIADKDLNYFSLTSRQEINTPVDLERFVGSRHICENGSRNLLLPS